MVRIMEEVKEDVRDIAEKLHIVKKREDPNEWLYKYLDDLSRAPPAKQAMVGAAAGALNGYIFTKVSKNAATVIGGSIILFQVANHLGYVKVNWKAVEKDMKEVKKEIRKSQGFIVPLYEEFRDFLSDNIYVGAGFVGGFVVAAIIA